MGARYPPPYYNGTLEVAVDSAEGAYSWCEGIYAALFPPNPASPSSQPTRTARLSSKAGRPPPDTRLPCRSMRGQTAVSAACIAASDAGLHFALPVPPASVRLLTRPYE